MTDAYNDQSPINFGKYIGKKLGNVPAEYLLYLWDKSEQGKTLYDKKLAVYIKDNLQAIKLEAESERQRRFYERR